jgi:RpiR family carbohydrate utilization transcriptional regulator
MTEPFSSLLQRLQSVAPGLPRAQQQVIATLLQDPERALSLGVDALARQAKVSMPTIMRTARQFGFDGVREFKLALAQDLARHAPIHSSVTMQDSTPDIVHKILSGAAASITALQQQLNPLILEKAAGLLAGAQRIDCYSVGATSAFMASDLQGRLFRLGRHAHAVHDAHQQLISAATLGPSGVAVAISHVGRMPFLLEAVGFARSQGAKVIAITRPDTALAQLADVVIEVSVPPDAVMRVGTEAYIAHLLVIELLMVLVLQVLGPDAARHLAQFKSVLQGHGQDVDQHPTVDWAWSSVEKGTQA